MIYAFLRMEVAELGICRLSWLTVILGIPSQLGKAPQGHIISTIHKGQSLNCEEYTRTVTICIRFLIYLTRLLVCIPMYLFMYPYFCLHLPTHMPLLFFFSLLSKNESGLIKSPACVCVCVCLSVSPPLITFEPKGGFS
jgi:hypothetical protein